MHFNIVIVHEILFTKLTLATYDVVHVKTISVAPKTGGIWVIILQVPLVVGVVE